MSQNTKRHRVVVGALFAGTMVVVAVVQLQSAYARSLESTARSMFTAFDQRVLTAPR